MVSDINEKFTQVGDSKDMKETIPQSPITSTSLQNPLAAAAAVAAELANASLPQPPPPAEGSVENQNNTKIKTWWVNGAFVIFIHLVALVALFTYRPTWQTWVLTYVSWQLSTLGITAGYHRLFSHRAYKASLLVRILFVFMGTMAFQGSVKWWVLRHRLHHRFTDTEHDPYNAKKGFWHSHMGWIFQQPTYQKMGVIDATDLNSDPIVRFQHRHYPILALLSGLVLPTFIAWLWNDPIGGYLYAGVVARVAVWHVTFFINSFAHWIGDQDFSVEFTARGNLLLALLTNGEGYHNFHHEFPKDYRNGIYWYHWDPTKWLIRSLKSLGLCWDLTTVSDNEINRAKAQTLSQKFSNLRSECFWGIPDDRLPNITPSQMKTMMEESNKTLKLFTLDGYVLDVTSFIPLHPGGRKLLLKYVGRDAGEGFWGGWNNHTQSARALVKELRIGKAVTEDGLPLIVKVNRRIAPNEEKEIKIGEKKID